MKTLFVVLIGFVLSAGAQDMQHQPQGNQIRGPGQGVGANLGWFNDMTRFRGNANADHDAWLRDLKAWRAERWTRMGYDDAEYRRPEFQWMHRNFVSPQVMVEERTLFDVTTGQWTVDRYLDDLEKRYGGIDSVLLWPVYPNIGIDNRNQWDLARDLPGGPEAFRRMVGDFHRRGVKVLLPTMAWDNGTRDPGMPHWKATAELMAELGVDGVNGDTFGGVPRAYRVASDATGHPVMFEPEGAPSDEALMWNDAGWDYWSYGFQPTASRQKWLEPRHLSHICDRWARDKTDDLQNAFFNGIGYVSWENIWGIWNQITDRDAEALRRVAAVERQFADLLVSKDWEPFVPVMQSGVFATKFPGNGVTLYLFVNRNEYDVDGEQIELPDGLRYYDVWHGKEIKPYWRRSDRGVFIEFPMEAHGYGALLVVDPGTEVAGLSAYLAKMAELTKTPLASYSHEWHFLPQKLMEIAPTKPAASAPEGMVKIPSDPWYEFKVTGIEIEGEAWVGLDVQYPWEDSPRRGHDHRMGIDSFYIDKYPVTNAEFKKFMDASGYKPSDAHNFLRDWKADEPNKPVTWVSLEDASAYAKWAGKRLPHEWEWQYAAQGMDGRTYPWGNEWKDSAVPAQDTSRELTGPADVTAHPEGASPFGVMDMVGNVWQWTDEYVDDHTRAAIVRGGSYYRPQNSIWYFPNTYKLGEHGKYLLMAPSKDRAGTLGFRCAMDAAVDGRAAQ